MSKFEEKAPKWAVFGVFIENKELKWSIFKKKEVKRRVK